MTKSSASVLGMLVAPAIPALQFVALSLAADTYVQRAGISEILLFLAGFFLVFYLFSTFFIVLFGVPIFLIARHFGVVSWWSASIAGAFVGILASVFMRLSPSYLENFFQFVPVATLSGLIFWVFWKRGHDSDSLS